MTLSQLITIFHAEYYLLINVLCSHILAYESTPYVEVPNSAMWKEFLIKLETVGIHLRTFKTTNFVGSLFIVLDSNTECVRQLITTLRASVVETEVHLMKIRESCILGQL